MAFRAVRVALEQWRAAEHRLEVLRPGSVEYDEARLDFAYWRTEYQRAFGAVQRGEPVDVEGPYEGNPTPPEQADVRL